MSKYLHPESWEGSVFGIDFVSNEVVFCGGERIRVEQWRDPLGQECPPSFARAAIFRGPSGLPFIVDIYAHHIPEEVH